MKKAPIPHDEAERMAALKNLALLDTGPEERFDRLTRLAKAIFEVPIALVTLVDEDRQWFKSKLGLDVDETPRDISFCGHVICGDGLFMVPDSSEDPRFADNPLATDAPNVRFYAGEPLRTLNGSKIGTLCIIDEKPRKISVSSLKLLRDLAEMAESEISAHELATTDFLTQISNRRGFNLLAQKSLNACKRTKTPASLVFIDLDRLKSINDQFGHSAGDEALQEFARQLTKTFRDADIAGRFGGDEFLIWMHNSALDKANEGVERLRESIQRFNEHGGQPYDIAFSEGVIEIDIEKDIFLEDAIIRADKAMFKNKTKKRPVTAIK